LKIKILINASNLHGGGAVAVASSFINQLPLIANVSAGIAVLVSTEVNVNLISKGTAIENFASYKVFDVYGLDSMWSGIRREFDKYDLIFTVFGPAYVAFSKKRHIFGFAQPWIIYPDNPVYNRLGFSEKIKYRLKYFVQSLFFARADALIVELDHVKKGLQNYGYLKDIPTHVVNSTVDSIFFSPEKWEPVSFPQRSNEIRLGVIARNYPHKNLESFICLKQVLFNQYDIRAEFYVTFSEEEWVACSEDYQREINNIGLLRLDQCPSFYDQVDGIVFPSLLECFSATPLETMIMKKPLFASDLSFIRDCSREYGNYFDPLDINDMAKVIANYYLNPTKCIDLLNDASRYVTKFSSANGRAKEYLAIIGASLENTEEV
tara:strand:- start:179 stop:1312 length:1134 start_codon:yes stop_codon:yes gene_type:complete